MNATKALELLSPIPSEDFLFEYFSDEVSKCCAIGHLIRLTSDNPANYARSNCDGNTEKTSLNMFVRFKVEEFIQKEHGTTTSQGWELSSGSMPNGLSVINNTPDINGYTQSFPKDRVMALLIDMEEAGY